MFIRFITTGGTIDKIYFDSLSQFEVGESQIKHILTEGLIQFDDLVLWDSDGGTFLLVGPIIKQRNDHNADSYGRNCT